MRPARESLLSRYRLKKSKSTAYSCTYGAVQLYPYGIEAAGWIGGAPEAAERRLRAAHADDESRLAAIAPSTRLIMMPMRLR